MQKAGNQVLINVQLIDVASDNHLWADAYTRTLDNVFGVEGEVAQKVADALKAKLSPAEAAAVAKVPTHNKEAYDAVLKAVYYLNESNRTGDQEDHRTLRLHCSSRPLTSIPITLMPTPGWRLPTRSSAVTLGNRRRRRAAPSIWIRTAPERTSKWHSCSRLKGRTKKLSPKPNAPPELQPGNVGIQRRARFHLLLRGTI